MCVFVLCEENKQLEQTQKLREVNTTLWGSLPIFNHIMLIRKLLHHFVENIIVYILYVYILCIYIKEEVNTALPGTPLFNDTRRFVQNSGHIVCYCLKDRLKGQNNLNF